MSKQKPYFVSLQSSNTRPKQVFRLFRFFWVVLSIILLLSNVYEVFYNRLSGVAFEKLLAKELYRRPVFSKQAHASSLNTTIQNRWVGQHVWPVPLWIILMFLQASPYIRRNYLNLHRILGRIAILLSAYMNVFIILMLVTKEKIYGPVEFSFDIFSPSKVFSFYSGSAVFSVYWFYCMIRMYQTAKIRRIMEHQYWAWQLMAIGFGTGTMRIVLVAYLLCYQARYGNYQLSAEELDVVMCFCGWFGFGGTAFVVDRLIAMGFIDIGQNRKKK